MVRLEPANLEELAEARSGTCFVEMCFGVTYTFGVLDELGALRVFGVVNDFGVLRGLGVCTGFGLLSGLGELNTLEEVVTGLGVFTTLGVVNLGVVTPTGLYDNDLGVVGTGICETGLARGLGDATRAGLLSLGEGQKET